jgi:hypothetical protein
MGRDIRTSRLPSGPPWHWQLAGLPAWGIARLGNCPSALIGVAAVRADCQHRPIVSMKVLRVFAMRTNMLARSGSSR